MIAWKCDKFRSTDAVEMHRYTQLLLGLAWEPLNHEVMELRENSPEIVSNGEDYRSKKLLYAILNNFFLDFLYGFSALHKWISNSYLSSFTIPSLGPKR